MYTYLKLRTISSCIEFIKKEKFNVLFVYNLITGYGFKKFSGKCCLLEPIDLYFIISLYSLYTSS